MDFSIAHEELERDSNRNHVRIGLHAAGSMTKVVDIDKCLLPSQLALDVYTTIRDWILQSGFHGWDAKAKEGLLREFTIRWSGKSQGNQEREVIFVNMITSSSLPQAFEELAATLKEKFGGEIDKKFSDSFGGFANSACDKKHEVPSPENIESVKELLGDKTVNMKVRGLDLQVSSASFFQTNTRQAEVTSKGGGEEQ
eukprot:765044-Hanusia_phi.AAC.2